MTFTLQLRNDEPADVFLISENHNLIAFVVTSIGGYIQKLGTSDVDFCLHCTKQTFNTQELSVYLVDDLALIDGFACTPVVLNSKQRGLFDVLSSV